MPDKKLSFSLNIGQLARYKDYLIPVLCFLLSVLLGLLVVKPNVSSISENVRDNKLLRVQLEELEAYQSQLEGYLDYQKDIEDSYLMLEQALPSEDGVPYLMTQVQQIASSSGVTVGSLQYSGGSKAALDVEEGPHIGKVRISLSGVVNPQAFISFVTNMERASRILDLEGLRYSYSQDDNEISFSSIVVSYYLPIVSGKLLPSVSQLRLEDSRVRGVLDSVRELKYYQVEEINLPVEMEIEEPAQATDSAT